jgi:hypothetical protein
VKTREKRYHGRQFGFEKKVHGTESINMRTLLTLLTFVWIIWLIGRLFKSQQPNNPTSAPQRKKVDSMVIEKEHHDPDSDDNKP